ncbi:MAG: hypothetical protein ACRDM7_21825 [Thermoleophilaceae bacterium]
MDDATYSVLAERITALVAGWKERLGLRDWTVHVEVLRAGLPPKEQEPENTSLRKLATVDPSWEYLIATVCFDAPALEDRSAEDLEDVVVHELVHVLVAEMRELVPDKCWRCGTDHTRADGAERHEERVVTALTRVLRDLAKGARP